MDLNFFWAFALTVVLIRIALYLHPIPAPTIAGFRTHHYMYGLAAVGIGLATNSLWIYAIGLGLFVDEATFLIMGGRSHDDNYSAVSILGTMALVCLVFVLRAYFVRPFQG